MLREDTLRICIIGNSHVACLREAWREMAPEYPRLEMRFFASRGSRIETLQLSDGVLSTQDADVTSDIRNTSGGLEFVRLNDFDVFLVHGLLPTPRLPVHLSSAVVRQCCEDVVDSAANTRLARLIRYAELPVFAGHVPMRAIETTGEAVIDYTRIHEAMRVAMARYGVVLLRQPEATVAGRYGTRAEFAKEAPRLAADNVQQHSLRYPEENIAHMNTDFGRHFLNGFPQQALETAVAPRSVAVRR